MSRVFMGLVLSNYYIVPFTNEEYREFRRQEFILRVNEFIFESLLRFKRQPDKAKNPVTLEAFCYTPSLEHVPTLMEYNAYPITMLFNEGYIRLYKDIGITLNVRKVISSESLPEGLEKTGSGMYYPK
jgi:hypothetical protein